MESEGPDESFGIEFTDPEYTRTANTLDLNGDPEGEDVEICSAEPPGEKITAAADEGMKVAAQVPKKVAENIRKGDTKAITAVEIAPKRSQRRMEAKAKAETAAAAAAAAAQHNKKEANKRGRKPRAAIPAAPNAALQTTPPGNKKDKREQRLLAIREAVEKAAAAVGGTTPPAPPSPVAEDFVEEEIIRSAEKKRRQAEEAKSLAEKKVHTATNTTTTKKKRKKQGSGAAAAVEEEEEEGEQQKQDGADNAGPSKPSKSPRGKKSLKTAPAETTTRRSKRSRGEEAAATETITPIVITPPVDSIAELSAMNLQENPDSNNLTTNEIAENAGMMDLSAPPSATAAGAGEEDEEEDEYDQYADKDPAGAARDWIMAALANPRGKEAASALLRESLENSVETIISNIEGTISNGQNNSLLVLGGRGAGKTLAVERALTAITTQWNTDAADPLVGIVRLVGWAHADERTAFKEIARQLCSTFQLQFSRTASLGDNIEFLRHVLDGLARAHKVAVFVLDDFDLFARRAKQTLLYCLLDALQTSGVQAVVLGTTVRHDCLDLLEKRVKSRLSHRSVMISPPSGAQNIEPAAAAAASPGSAAAVAGASPGGGGVEDLPKEGSIEILRKMLSLPACFPHKQHIKAHNTAVKAAVAHTAAIKALTEFATFRTSLHDLRNVAQATVAASSTHPKGLITHEDIFQACTNLGKASDLGMEGYIAGLSVLELAVLVGAHRAARRVDGDPINFEMAFKEFYTYSTSGDHVDNYTKGAACKAFFKLAEMGLLSPSTGKADARVVSGNHFAPMYVQITALELRTGISEHQTCPAKLKDWATREGGPLTTAAANLE